MEQIKQFPLRANMYPYFMNIQKVIFKTNKKLGLLFSSLHLFEKKLTLQWQLIYLEKYKNLIFYDLEIYPHIWKIYDYCCCLENRCDEN